MPVKRAKYGVWLKFMVTFFILIAALLTIMNIYPMTASRDLVFESKQSSLQNRASVLSSSLAALDTLTVEGVNQVMELLDVIPLDRIIITDDSGRILYDTSIVDSGVGRFALFPEISRALSGSVVFYSKYSDGAFMSRAAAPVTPGGRIIGAVYLYEYDSKQAELIAGIQSNMRSISLSVGALALFLILLFTRALTMRITELVRAMRIVRDGNYDYLLKTKGADEITELGDEFNDMTKRLRNTENLRRRFVSDASHELKTPLASIRLLSDSIAHSEQMSVDTMREFVSDIGTEAERLQRTTEKLLTLTRIDDGALAAKSKVNMKDVAERTLRMLSPLAGERNISLYLNTEKDCFISIYEDDLYRIVFNLIENAIKYNTENGSVTVCISAEDRVAVMTVEDTGVGIPEEDIPHIFSRFYRVDQSRSVEAGGSGLGLSIVRDAAGLYGGSVQVVPGRSRGAEFKVIFPVYDENEDTENENLS
ncbi:MAG: HAMP domain-containing histidine kinase [Oscillospiraceae bacterium]|nr:HAMP domain-containing histidine kinase [Oscillospiraceae bacterium]